MGQSIQSGTGLGALEIEVPLGLAWVSPVLITLTTFSSQASGKRALKDTRKLPSWPIKPSDPWGGQVQLLSERCWLRATPVPPAPSILGTCPGRETETPPCTGCTGSRAWRGGSRVAGTGRHGISGLRTDLGACRLAGEIKT